MGNTPNIAGMVADPDFQGLAPADKRAALGKLTGDKSFASLNDGETMQFVSRFQKPADPTWLESAQQSKQQFLAKNPIQLRPERMYNYEAAGAGLPIPAIGTTTGEQAQQIRDQAKQGLKMGMEAGGSMLGGGAFSGVKGLLGVGARMLGAGAGAGVANVGANLLTGQKPTVTEAGKTAAIYGGTEGAGEALTGVARFAGKGVAKLFGAGPERIAEVGKYFPAKEAVEQKVVQAEAQSRAAFKAAYPAIDEAPVNVAATKNLAKQAADNIVSARVPAPVSRVANIPEPGANVLTSDDPATILKELAGFDNIPFRKAQLYRSSIEQYISRAGGKLPSDVYGQLKAVSGSLGDGLRATAKQEGQLAQFETAEAMFKQHAADFWNKGAPLKPFLNAPPGTKPAVLNRFLQTANDSRALDALERRGVSTDDVRAILAKGSKAISADVKDAATLKNLGQPALDQQVATASRQALKDKAVKGGAGLIGAGGLYELIRSLATGRKQ